MDLKSKAEQLCQKIKHIIITHTGHTAKDATHEEFYEAFCSALREEVMINWTASVETLHKNKVRSINFLSMEYLPGRYFGKNVSNMGAHELIQAVFEKMGRNYKEIAACESDPGLGHGGLGRLSSCFLDSLATLKYPARAYGIRYQYGIFEQEIWNGVQVERPDCWLLNTNPWELRRDIHATSIHYRGNPIHGKNKHGDDVYLLEDFEEVRALPFDTPVVGYSETPDFSVVLLRLWSTKESPRNFHLQRYNAGFLDQAAENTSLTDVLYPSDNTELGKRMRLKQEFLLVSASLQDIIRRHLKVYQEMESFVEKVRIQINDTHPALVIAELIRKLTKDFEFPWKEAVEISRTVCSYTNHTILREALEEWNEHRVVELLPRQHQIIQKLNAEFCDSIRGKFPSDEERVRRLSLIEHGQIRMAHLAIYGTHTVNGVAQLHSEILKQKVFKDFYDLYPEKFTNVTNGVTHRRWLLFANPLLAEFITKRIGKDWIFDFSQIQKLAAYASDPNSQEEFLAIKRKNKQELLTFLARENPLRDNFGKIIENTKALNENALFDVHIKRIHEYKRQLLNALHLIMVYLDLIENPEARKISRLALFGGKAAAGYARAKQSLELISAISRKFREDPKINQKLAVIFVENYNVSKAELMIPAADLSEQISTAGWEASGTGNMKLAMNGALTIGTEDGANIEMRLAVGDAWWPFRFGASAEENERPYQPWEVYNSNPLIKRAVDTLKDGLFATTDLMNSSFNQIFASLVENDPFRVLQDLSSYYETQKKVEELYSTPEKWAEFAIHNIAAMGPFSTDRSIHDYAKNIWGISPYAIDPEILKKVREEYSETV